MADFANIKFRVNLKVPFHQKDEAKGRGARWDKEKKTWYVILTPHISIIHFKPWLSEKDQEAIDTWMAETKYGDYIDMSNKK